jgi:hypothetical protein
MDITTYKEALEKAKKDLENANHRLAVAQEQAIEAERNIVELRETIAALAKLCGEQYVEEDALGLTDIVRQVFKTTTDANGLDAQAVREKIERMGYTGRWANLLAAVHTVIKRLHEKKEIEVVTNTNGSYYFRWAAHPRIRNATSYRSNALTGRKAFYGEIDHDKLPDDVRAVAGRLPVDFRKKK